MTDIRSRLESSVHTLAHIGISPGDFQKVAREYQAGIPNPKAESLRLSARDYLESLGIGPDGYIDIGEIAIDSIEPPLPSAILGALAVLGTSEIRLQLLEPLVH